MNTSQSSQQFGFTLIELMVVIVIISILASLIVMNISGVDQRKAMQAREVLMMDLKRMNREANDQSRVVALVTMPATDVTPFQYRFDEYLGVMSQSNANQINHQPTTLASISLRSSNGNTTWKAIDSKAVQSLPEHVSFTVESQSYDFKNANNSDLMGANAPKLIWLGNGEVKPVSIQMYYDQKPVGDLIQIDYLGKIIDAS